MAECYDMPYADPSDGTDDDTEVNFGGDAGRRETLSRGRRIETLKELGVLTTEQLRVKSGIGTVSLEASSANQLRMAIDQIYARLEQQEEPNA